MQPLSFCADLILANESLVVIAIFVTPHSLIPVVENETILISLRAGFAAIPIGKTETLSSDPLPTAFATPVTGAKPKLVGFASGAKSLAEVLLNFVVGNSRQRSLISFTHAIGRIPVKLFRMIFVVNVALWRRRPCRRGRHPAAGSGCRCGAICGFDASGGRAFVDGPTSLMVDVPSGAGSARLTNDAIWRVADEKSVGRLRVADVSDFTAR